MNNDDPYLIHKCKLGMTIRALGIEHTPLTLGSWPCSPQSCLYKTSHQAQHPRSWAPGLLGCMPDLSQSTGLGEEPEGALPHAPPGSKETGGTGSPQPPAPRCDSQGLALRKPPSSGKHSQISLLNLPNCLLPEKTGMKTLLIGLCQSSSPLIVLRVLHLKCPRVPGSSTALKGSQSDGGDAALPSSRPQWKEGDHPARRSGRRQVAVSFEAGGPHTEGGP